MANTSKSLLDAVRSGDATALTSWADSLEGVGDAKGAAAIRSLPELAELVRRGLFVMEDWHGILPNRVRVSLGRDGDSGPFQWGCEPTLGEGPLTRPGSRQNGCAPDDHSCGGHLVAALPLLTRWNEFGAGIEWLARSAGMGVVEVFFEGGSPSATGRPFDMDSLDSDDLPAFAGDAVRRCVLRRPSP